MTIRLSRAQELANNKWRNKAIRKWATNQRLVWIGFVRLRGSYVIFDDNYEVLND